MREGLVPDSMRQRVEPEILMHGTTPRGGTAGGADSTNLPKLAGKDSARGRPGRKGSTGKDKPNGPAAAVASKTGPQPDIRRTVASHALNEESRSESSDSDDCSDDDSRVQAATKGLGGPGRALQSGAH